MSSEPSVHGQAFYIAYYWFDQAPPATWIEMILVQCFVCTPNRRYCLRHLSASASWLTVSILRSIILQPPHGVAVSYPSGSLLASHTSALCYRVTAHADILQLVFCSPAALKYSPFSASPPSGFSSLSIGTSYVLVYECGVPYGLDML